MLLKVNVGCPYYCNGYVCVDLHPQDERVRRAEATFWLSCHNNDLDEIRAYNLIEHLPSVGKFYYYVEKALKRGGLLKIRTDNAAWLPFYIPVLNCLGWGAHSSDNYRHLIDRNEWMKHIDTSHYAVFSKKHLEHYGRMYNLEVVRIWMDWRTLGARLYATYRK